MEIVSNILKLSAGVGLFLFAMYLLEESLKNLSGRRFKLFLQKSTKNRLGAVAGGAVVTSVLQSSSMVSLMVLAFVGAGVFTMKSALAIILGANLGTTIDSWIVATLGFKINIEAVAYPAVCLGGFLLILFARRKKITYLAYFLLGFGLLFIALSFMKTAMEAQVKAFDFTPYKDMPLVVFLGIGFIITTLVQSSSVTMALTLSALFAGAIEFVPAAAIVLGSETGTTIKIMLSTLGGNATKKRVGLGNLVFNMVLTVVSFALLRPILYLITDIFTITDPLIGLVTFSSLVNLISILIFLPFLNSFAKFLLKFYKDTDASTSAFISHANVAEPETALDLFKRETKYFIHNCMVFNLNQFEIDTTTLQKHPEFYSINLKRNYFSKTPDEKYNFLKQHQGELQAFYLLLRGKLQEVESNQLNQLISSVRSSMYAVKSIHDLGNSISNLSRSSKDIKFNFFIQHKEETKDLYAKLFSSLMKVEKNQTDQLKEIYTGIEHNYSSALNTFYENAQNASIEELDITIALNFNRELFTSNKALLMAVKDFILNEKQAEEFIEILNYKT